MHETWGGKGRVTGYDSTLQDYRLRRVSCWSDRENRTRSCWRLQAAQGYSVRQGSEEEEDEKKPRQNI